MKSKNLIQPKVLDVFDQPWWLSKTWDKGEKYWMYSFELGDWPNTKSIEAKSADKLVKKIWKLIEERSKCSRS